VQRLVEGAGVELKKTGKDLAGRCPFHADETASLIVTPAKNLWHCFGCGIGGGPIDWVMKLKGISFRHAVELLREDSSLAAEGFGDSGAIKRSTVRGLPAPVHMDADGCSLLRLRELRFTACVASGQVELEQVRVVPTLQRILRWITQLPDGGPDALAQLDVELDGSDSILVAIHELPPGSPGFRPHLLDNTERSVSFQAKVASNTS
jgi:hypothetical protein